MVAWLWGGAHLGACGNARWLHGCGEGLTWVRVVMQGGCIASPLHALWGGAHLGVSLCARVVMQCDCMRCGEGLTWAWGAAAGPGWWDSSTERLNTTTPSFNDASRNTTSELLVASEEVWCSSCANSWT